jgi:hypothetical protein
VLLSIWWLSGQGLSLAKGPGLGLSKEDKFTLPMAVCSGVVIGLANPPWAIRLLGIVIALLYLGLGWIRLRRYYAAAAGWFLAGLTVPRYFVWPDEQQYALFFFLGAVATAFEGSRELIWYLRFQHSRPSSD